MNSPASSRFNWRLILLLVCIAALNYCDRTAVTAVFPLLRRDLGMSDLGLAATGSLFLWSYALCSPICGWIADRVPRGWMILASLTAWSVVAIWASMAHSPREFLATRIALGIAEAGYIPAAVGLLAQKHAPAQRGTAISFHTAALSVGTITGATFAGYMGERHGWRVTYLILGLAGFLLAAIAFPSLSRKSTPDSSAEVHGVSVPAAFRHIAGVPSYWILLTQSMIASVGVWMFLNWLPLYLKETFMLSLALAGFSGAALVDLPGTFGVVAGGNLSDWMARKSGRRRMLLQSICYLAASPLLLIFTRKPAIVVTFAAVFVFFLLRAIALANENPLLCDLIASPYRSMSIGLMHAANCAAGGAGIFVAGLLKKTYGLHGAFASISVFTLMVAALTGLGYTYFLPRDLQRLHPSRELEPSGAMMSPEGFVSEQ